MNKKEIASYIIIDSATFIKKTVKKGTSFSIKFFGLIACISSTILIGDTIINNNIYDKHNISSIDLLQNNNQLIIEKPINVLPIVQEDEHSISNLNLRHSYVPIVAEFSEKNSYNNITMEELSSLNNNLKEQYKNICDTGIVSRLICIKYNKYEEIKNLKS